MLVSWLSSPVAWQALVTDGVPCLLELASLSLEVLHSRAASGDAGQLCDAARSLIRHLLAEGTGVANLSVVSLMLCCCVHGFESCSLQHL